MPTISVIVPIYNAEKYLHRCIDSILAQNFTDFELLLIDDGSTDNSGFICDEYAQKDRRIRVFHKKNGGVSSARNLGLDNAQGEWITFVDSDDWIENSLWSSAQIPETDLIVTSYIDIRVNNNIILDDIIWQNIEASRYLEINIGDNLFRGPWAKLFKRVIIEQNHLRFYEKMSLGEDTVFVRQYLLHIESLHTSSHSFYVVSEISSLSNAFVTVEDAIYAINSLFDALELVEGRKNIDVTDVKLNDVRFYLIRAIKYIIKKNVSINKKKEDLSKLLGNKNVQRLVSDSSYIHKGTRRIIFDVLSKYKFYTLLTLYIHIYQYD